MSDFLFIFAELSHLILFTFLVDIDEGLDERAAAEHLEGITKHLSIVCVFTVVQTAIVALEFIEMTTFDIIFIADSIGLKEDSCLIEAYEFLRLIRIFGLEIPIVLLTSEESDKNQPGLPAIGFHAANPLQMFYSMVLLRPYTRSEICMAICHAFTAPSTESDKTSSRTTTWTAASADNGTILDTEESINDESLLVLAELDKAATNHSSGHPSGQYSPYSSTISQAPSHPTNILFQALTLEEQHRLASSSSMPRDRLLSQNYAAHRDEADDSSYGEEEDEDYNISEGNNTKIAFTRPSSLSELLAGTVRAHGRRGRLKHRVPAVKQKRTLKPTGSVFNNKQRQFPENNDHYGITRKQTATTLVIRRQKSRPDGDIQHKTNPISVPSDSAFTAYFAKKPSS